MMAEQLGDGEWTFVVEENWAKIPDEIVLGDVAAVGVDSRDNVYAFNRGENPVAVFDKDGNLLQQRRKGSAATAANPLALRGCGGWI